MLMRKLSPNLNSGFLTLLFDQGNQNCGFRYSGFN